MAKNIDFMGATFPDVPSIRLPQHEGGLVSFDDTTDATATADKILQGFTAYANGQKLTGTASGGITPSGTYSITSNGTYDVTQYASADVNVSGGGGGDHDAEDAIVARTISGAYENSRVTSIGDYAFYGCTSLTTASFSSATSIGTKAFQNCRSLTTASFPSVTSIGTYVFQSCTSLTTVSFPSAKSIGAYAFQNCTSLTTASFPSVTSIGAYAFSSCKSLTEIYFMASSVANLASANAFANTPMSNSSYTGSFGSIYVPASLVDSYKSATRWSAYSARITSYVE